MTAIGTELLTDLVAEADFAETLSVTPVGGDAASKSALVQRTEARIEAVDGRGRTVVYEALVRVLVSAFAAPAVGDNWTIAKTRGGTGVAGWMAGAPKGGDGTWEIPVQLRTREDAGGYDPDA